MIRFEEAGSSVSILVDVGQTWNHLLCGRGGTVGWYQRHLHSWDRGQLMAGGGGEGVQWQVRSPTPRRHLECLVTSSSGGLQVGFVRVKPLKASCNQGKPPEANWNVRSRGLVEHLLV